jgi:hypothetical protein
MVKKLLEIAAAEVGYLEKKSNAQLDDKTANAGSNNYTKYWRDAKILWGWDYQAQPWCACFVSWCFERAGIVRLIAPFYYCPTGVNNFKKAGQWVTGNPQAGDVIFFKDSSGVACHVGLVERVDSGKVYTIEGNTSATAGVDANGGCVARKSYALGYGSILGYGRPAYKNLEEELTVGQYEELCAKIDALAAKIPAPPMVYAWMDDNMPEWARATVQKLYDRGILKGGSDGKLNLTEDMLRVLVLLDRAEAFGV